MTELRLAGERVLLLSERALFWRDALIVADLHWGKAAAFRAHAVPIPHGTTIADLNRLSNALGRTGANRLILLGDVLHAREGRAPQTMQAIGRWRDHHASLEILMVRGNHDRHAGDPPGELRIDCAEDTYREGPFAFQHHPAPVKDAYALAGHLHPCVRLTGRGKTKLKLPCFWFTESFAVLPAFGSFTGCAMIQPEPDHLVYALVEDEVIRV